MIITEATLYICHNGAEVVHYGFIQQGKISSGQPYYEPFDPSLSEGVTAWVNRLQELGINNIDPSEYLTTEIPS